MFQAQSGHLENLQSQKIGTFLHSRGVVLPIVVDMSLAVSLSNCLLLGVNVLFSIW